MEGGERGSLAGSNRSIGWCGDQLDESKPKKIKVKTTHCGSRENKEGEEGGGDDGGGERGKGGGGGRGKGKRE